MKKIMKDLPCDVLASGCAYLSAITRMRNVRGKQLSGCRVGNPVRAGEIERRKLWKNGSENIFQRRKLNDQ